jgi:hypothetical protein
MLRIFVYLSFIILRAFLGNAQSRPNKFLTDLSFKDFGPGSKLSEIATNKKISANLFIVSVNDSISFGTLKNQNINFYNLEHIDQLFLNFKNDKLEDIVIEFSEDPSDGGFEKTINLFKAKFGEPVSSRIKNSLFRIYFWKDGESKLMVKPLKFSFIVKYYQSSNSKQ